jgi:hypothetical protein
MTNRGALGRVISTLVLAAALWALSGGLASAQCDGPCPTPGFVSCPTPEVCQIGGDCTLGTVPPVSCSGSYSSSQKVNVFSFGPDNSIQIKFADVTCPFSLGVQLISTTQLSFHPRVSSLCTQAPPALLEPPTITCNETVMVDLGGAADDPTSFCAVYRVNQPFNVPPSTNTCWVGPVDYIVGSSLAKGNKHDYFLLRDPDTFDTALPPPDGDDGTQCFIQNITTGILDRNYTPGELKDPGLGGRACCPSDYVVARQKIRPVSK